MNKMPDYNQYIKSNLLKRIKFRWDNFGPPIPGDTNETIIVNKEHEKNIFLRHLRGLIGYGCGWTFRSAFIEWIKPFAIIAIFILLWFAIAISLNVITRWYICK